MAFLWSDTLGKHEAILLPHTELIKFLGGYMCRMSLEVCFPNCLPWNSSWETLFHCHARLLLQREERLVPFAENDVNSEGAVGDVAGYVLSLIHI